MRKQTKLVAVLSAAALMAVGASMTSFAATGWAEENGTWVYYDNDGSEVTDEWKKSGNNWFYLDSDGYMATDALIEDDDDYFYVGSDGAMVTNQWVALENEDAGDDDEPESYWYYFQANGKSYVAGNGNSAAFKTVNGKKYVFDDEGRMQYGWIDDAGERLTGDDAWVDAVYYAGDENDGAQSIGWKEIHILDDAWDPDSEVNGDLFDEDQDRWFYFKSNGKRYQDEEKTINGRKYRFDTEGRMIAEWFTDTTATTSKGTLVLGTISNTEADATGTTAGDPIGSATDDGQGSTGYATSWRFYGDPEDGARVTKGWFQVVPSEYVNAGDYDDSEDAWYYSDNDGKLVASELKTINGKKYGFDSFGRMLDGLQMLEMSGKNDIYDVYDTDNFDDEDKFVDFYILQSSGATNAVQVYYFGDESDGAMKTGRQTIDLDGDSFTFEFEKSGSKKGTGIEGLDNKKYYIGGKLSKADSDEKYEIVVKYTSGAVEQLGVLDFIESFDDGYATTDVDDGDETNYYAGSDIMTSINANESNTIEALYLVNTAGSIVEDKSKAKNGDDIIVSIDNGKIERIYEEN